MAGSMSIPEKIGQLLALADATTHPEEHKLAMERVMREASRHSIDLATARAAVAKGQKREQPTHKRIVVGKKGQVALSWYVDLLSGLASINDLQVTYQANGLAINVFGMPSDIEVTEAIYATALTAMVTGGDAYLKTGEYKKDVAPRRVKIKTANPAWTEERADYRGIVYDRWGDKVPKFLYEWTYVTKPVSGMTARQNFYKGFVGEVLGRLRTAKREIVQAAKVKAAELEQVANVESSSTALILHAKADEVRDYYTEFYKGTKMGTYRGGSKSPVHSAGASAAGRAHGASTNLGSGSSRGIGGARTAIGS